MVCTRLSPYSAKESTTEHGVDIRIRIAANRMECGRLKGE